MILSLEWLEFLDGLPEIWERISDGNGGLPCAPGFWCAPHWWAVENELNSCAEAHLRLTLTTTICRLSWYCWYSVASQRGVPWSVFGDSASSWSPQRRCETSATENCACFAFYPTTADSSQKDGEFVILKRQIHY